MARSPELGLRFRRFLAARPELVAFIHDPLRRGHAGRLLASILDEDKLHRVLSRMLDENEFLSPYGLRSLSRHHAEHPLVFRAGDRDYRSNALIIRALRRRAEVPGGSALARLRALL
jgi:hypothetical protein